MNFGRNKQTTPRSLQLHRIGDVLMIGRCVLVITGAMMIQALIYGTPTQRLSLMHTIGATITPLHQELGALLQGVSQIVTHHHLLQAGEQHQNHTPELQDARSSIISSEFFGQLNLWGLNTILQEHPETALDLLGFSSPQSYLIVLQNTNERRPNGGFFGSYVHVTLDQGVLTYLEFRDSYLPGFDRPGVGLDGPDRLLEFLPTDEIHFVGANKIGFTYADGGHIKSLYELAYPRESVRGVIFVRLDRIVQFVPELAPFVTEWQFVNAITDQIPRDSWQKKANYLKSVQDTFFSILPSIANSVLQKSQSNQEPIANLYLEQIPGSMHTMLRHSGWSTRFDPEMLYVWRSNTSYSKTDGFVDETLYCEGSDSHGNIHTFIQSVNKERIDFSYAKNNISYQCSLTYHFDLPTAYLDRIDQLSQTYGVTLGEREHHILGVDPKRGARAILYLGDQRDITGITGEIYDQTVFDTPFGQAISYKVRIEEQEGQRRVERTMVQRNRMQPRTPSG